MSEYIYLRRSPKLMRTCLVQKPDGTTETMKLASYTFLCKPWGRSIFEVKDPNQVYWMICNRLEKIWDGWVNKGGAYPNAGAVSYHEDHKRHDIAIGSSVLSWERAPISYGDYDMGGGKKIGKVILVNA